ncbi:hypothetical protein MCW82_29340 [Azospirillum doebereinerae]|nr:hypothetical protein [Azospirillum doebereinerae]MCG5243880.1 hypothetical protein [Azospirillum doebereinerae]
MAVTWPFRTGLRPSPLILIKTPGPALEDNEPSSREAIMLTREDCLALCDLSEEEIAAIMEHEHIPELCAMEFGHYLVETARGQTVLRRLILDDIHAAEARGDHKHAMQLKRLLYRFAHNHPLPAASPNSASGGPVGAEGP